MEVRLRPLLPADIPAAQAITASFGWPHRLEDWALACGLGEGLIADRGGVAVGTGMTWCWGDAAATLGHIGILGALQGQGLGRRLLAALLVGLEGRWLSLHATEAGMGLYASFGFRPQGRVTQYQGVLPAVPPRADAGIRAMRPSDLPAIVALDHAATGLARARLMAEAAETGVVLEGRNGPAGFGLMRRFGRGWVVGPVVVPDDPKGALQARAIVAALLQGCGDTFVRVDASAGAGLDGWLLGLGLADAGSVIPMHRGKAPAAGPLRVATLAGQAFG